MVSAFQCIFSIISRSFNLKRFSLRVGIVGSVDLSRAGIVGSVDLSTYLDSMAWIFFRPDFQPVFSPVFQRALKHTPSQNPKYKTIARIAPQETPTSLIPFPKLLQKCEKRSTVLKIFAGINCRRKEALLTALKAKVRTVVEFAALAWSYAASAISIHSQLQSKHKIRAHTNNVKYYHSPSQESIFLTILRDL